MNGQVSGLCEGPRSASRSVLDVTWAVSGVLAGEKNANLGGFRACRRPNVMPSSDVCIMHAVPCNVNDLGHLLEV